MLCTCPSKVSLAFLNAKTPQILSAIHRNFSCTPTVNYLQKLSTVKIVDNSELGKSARESGSKVKIIHIYNKAGIARTGDKVLVTVKKQKTKGYIVGCVQKQKPMLPKYDTNNIVLIDETGTPMGTRIRAPLPAHLRGKGGDFTKILSIGTKFV